MKVSRDPPVFGRHLTLFTGHRAPEFALSQVVSNTAVET